MIHKLVRSLIGICFLLLGSYIILVDLWHNNVLHVISAVVGGLFVLSAGAILSLKRTQAVIDFLVRTFRRAKDAEGGKPDEPDVGSGPEQGRPRIR